MEYEYKGKQYRRKRVHEGESLQGLTPDLWTLEAAKNDRGLICRRCHKLRLWGQMECVYEIRSGDVYRSWVCLACGTYLRNDNITDMGYAYDNE